MSAVHQPCPENSSILGLAGVPFVCCEEYVVRLGVGLLVKVNEDDAGDFPRDEVKACPDLFLVLSAGDAASVNPVVNLQYRYEFNAWKV